MPRMPLSGVRISWLTMARKRLFARLAASAWSRASASARSASARSVTSRPTLCVSVAPSPSVRTSTSRHAIQRGPSSVAAIFWSWVRVPSSPHRDGALREHRQVEMAADQRIAGPAGERAERVVGVGDDTGRVAPHDDVALRLEKAARAFLGFPELPVAVAELLDPRASQALDLVMQRAIAADHEGERRMLVEWSRR